MKMVAVAGFAVAAFVSAAMPASSIEPAPPPPEWSASDWAALPPEKRQVVLREFATSPSDDPAAKAVYIASNPDPGPDPEDVLARQAEMPSNPADELVLGILDSGQSPFSPEVFIFNNSWAGIRDGSLVQAFAGVRASDPSQGIILLLSSRWPPADEAALERPGTGREYPTPTASGSVTLTAASGENLSFTTDEGVTGIFGIDSKRYQLNP